MSLTQKSLVLGAIAILLFATASAAPALEVLSGNLDMGNNNITALNHLNGNDASQLSFLGSSIDSGDITDDTIDNTDIEDGGIDNSSLNSSDGYSVGFLSLGTALTDGNVSDTLTVGSSGEVDTGALSGAVSNKVNGFVSVATPLTAGNLSSGAVTSDKIADNSIDDVDVVDNGLDNSSLTMNDGYTFDFVSLKTALGVGNLSLGSNGGLKGDGSGNVVVEPADFAGTGLEDNSDSLRIASGAAGTGLTGGSGSALSIAADGVGSNEIASGAVGGAEISNNNVVNSSHTNLGNGLTDAGSDGSIDVQASDGTLTVGSGGVGVANDGVTNTSLDSSDAYAVKNVTVRELVNMKKQVGDLPTCGSTAPEGSIGYNNTGHWGCNGTSWNRLY